MSKLEIAIIRSIETSEITGKKAFVDHVDAVDEDGSRTFVRKMSDGKIFVYEEAKKIATIGENYFTDVYVRMIAALIK